MYILELIHGIARISADDMFRLKSSTLALAGADVFRPPSLNVAGRVSSTKIEAWSKISSMNDIRLGRSLESTPAACDGLLPADLVCFEGELTRDSSAGWAGNSLICSGSRRTRLPNGAIVGGVRSVVVLADILHQRRRGTRQRQKRCKNSIGIPQRKRQTEEEC